MVESPGTRKKNKLPIAARRGRPLYMGIKRKRVVIKGIRTKEIEGAILVVHLETREIVCAPHSIDLELTL